MFNYYAVFDFENTQIGFNGKVLDLTPGPSPDPSNPEPENKAFPVWVIILIIVAVVMIVAAVFFYVRIRNKRLEGQLNKE
jgi:heme/copper-type cytochrome/quinol oxidase subunit 2